LQRPPATGDPWAAAHRADDRLRLQQQAASAPTPVDNLGTPTTGLLG
jgi:hypothetical protein